MRKTFFYLFVSFLLLIIFPINVFADNIDESKLKLSDIESIVLEHIEQNSLNIEIDSIEYVNYLMSVLLDDEDRKLAENPFYEQILFYASEYMYQLDEKNEIVDDDNEKNTFDIDIAYESTIEEIKDEIKQEEFEAQQEIIEYKKLNPDAIQPFSSYNRTAAANYAERWYNGRNSQYKSYPKDCTNFVSQAVHAGGKSMLMPRTRPPGINKTTLYWYSERYSLPHYNYGYRDSSSWVNVEDFKTYWGRTQTIVQSSSNSRIIGHANVGDIVQLRRASDGRWYHSMIVHRKANGTIYLAGHTNNTINKSILDLNDSGYRLIKF